MRYTYHHVSDHASDQQIMYQINITIVNKFNTFCLSRKRQHTQYSNDYTIVLYIERLYYTINIDYLGPLVVNNFNFTRITPYNNN